MEKGQADGFMTQYFPIIVERESNGTLGAWVAVLPGVYAEADTAAATRRDSLRFVGVGALLGRGTSRAKAASSRSNGRKGGRPGVSRAAVRGG